MMTPTQWREAGQLIKVGDHNIFYIDNGTSQPESEARPVIILIHGFPTSSWDWHKIWDDLGKQYRLIAMDMLGFGFSDKPDPYNYTIHEQADIVEALIGELALQDYHILAHDYGDTVTQEIIARQNEKSGKGKTLSVCFLNGGLFPETHKALLIQKLLLGPFGKLVNKLTTFSRFETSMNRVFGPNTLASPEELAYFWELINHNNGRHIFHNLITYMNDRITHRERWVEGMKSAIMPIGLINGSYDPVSGAHMIAHYKNIIGEPIYLKEFSSIGHYPQVESPSDVLSSYLEFLSLINA